MKLTTRFLASLFAIIFVILSISCAPRSVVASASTPEPTTTATSTPTATPSPAGEKKK